MSNHENINVPNGPQYIQSSRIVDLGAAGLLSRGRRIIRKAEIPERVLKIDVHSKRKRPD